MIVHKEKNAKVFNSMFAFKIVALMCFLWNKSRLSHTTLKYLLMVKLRLSIWHTCITWWELWIGELDFK